MSARDRTVAEINAVLDELSAQGREWRALWVAHAVCARHNGGLGDGDHADFWRANTYTAVRELVTRTINRRAGDRPDISASNTMSLFGWQHLQDHYVVVRDGEEVGVPISSLTRVELDAKASVYRKMGAACFAHADELDRYAATIHPQAA